MTSNNDSSTTTPENNHGSEGKNPVPEPDFLVVGKIQRPHGVRGELKIEIMTAYPEWLQELDVVYVGNDPEASDAAIEYPLAGTRFHQHNLLIRLGGVDDRNAADLLRGKLVMIRVDQSVPLEEDEFYEWEIIGMAVYTDQGEYLGDVMEIMETGANDVFVVQGGSRGPVLIPDIEDVIDDIDPDERKITITPLPGLLPGDEEDE